MAARRERGLLDPDAAPGESVFDHTIWAIASDGDIEEGVTSEASSLAGAPAARQPRRHLRPEPHLDRGRHRRRPQRGHGQAVRGVRLARAGRRLDRRRGPEGGQGRQLPRGRPGPLRRASSRPGTRRAGRRWSILRTDPRLAGAQRPEHRQGARLRARRGRGARHQAGARLRPRPALRGGRRRRWRAPARSSTAAGSGTPSGTSGSPSGRPTTPTAFELLGPAARAAAPGGLAGQAADLRGGQGRRDPQGEQRRAQRALATCCPSCGEARRTWPRATTRPWRASRRSCPPTSRPSCGARATPTAAPCTSASASTPWARS